MCQCILQSNCKFAYDGYYRLKKQVELLKSTGASVVRTLSNMYISGVLRGTTRPSCVTNGYTISKILIRIVCIKVRFIVRIKEIRIILLRI